MEYFPSFKLSLRPLNPSSGIFFPPSSASSINQLPSINLSSSTAETLIRGKKARQTANVVNNKFFMRFPFLKRSISAYCMPVYRKSILRTTALDFDVIEMVDFISFLYQPDG